MEKEPMKLKKILAFHELVLGKTEEDKRKIAQYLDVDYDEYRRRIVGKEKEAEFLVILRALKTLKHVKAYDEEISRITGEFTSDYEVELTDGYRMLIEVKHTDNEMFEISNGNLRKRIEYAQSIDLPLRFAISIKGYWGLFTSQFLQCKKGRISLSDCIDDDSKRMNSTWDDEFETCSYGFPPNIQIKSVYAHDHPEGMGISFEPFGELISYELNYNGKTIFQVEGKNSKDIITTILIEALQDRLANDEQKIIQNDGNTIIIDRTSEFNIIREYEFLLSIIKHVSIKDSATQSDNVSMVSTEREFAYPTLEYVRMCLSNLNEKGLDIVVFKGNNGYPFNEYRREFWTRKMEE